jgi:hypothetical protein
VPSPSTEVIPLSVAFALQAHPSSLKHPSILGFSCSAVAARAFVNMPLAHCRDGAAYRSSSGGGQLPPDPTISLRPLRTSVASYNQLSIIISFHQLPDIVQVSFINILPATPLRPPFLLQSPPLPPGPPLNSLASTLSLFLRVSVLARHQFPFGWFALSGCTECIAASILPCRAFAICVLS